MRLSCIPRLSRRAPDRAILNQPPQHLPRTRHKPGAWRPTPTPPPDANASSAGIVQLRLAEEEWRAMGSLLEGAQEMEEEPLEELDE
jgi:hypothetical protein